MGKRIDNHGVGHCIRKGLNVVHHPKRADALDWHVGGAATLSGDRLGQLRGDQLVSQ